MSINESLKAKFDSLAPHLNESLTRLWAATEAIALGRGGITEVSIATGLSPKTIRVGIRELVGWVERSETQQIQINVGFRSSTQPTNLKSFWR